MESKLITEDRSIVVPGEELAIGMDYLPATGTYRDGESIISKRLGLVRVEGKVLKITPIAGQYAPKRNDVIIAQVKEVTYSSWLFNTFSAYPAMLGMKDATSDFIQRGADLTKYFSIGDYVMVKIVNVTPQKLIDLTTKGPGLRKLRGGRIIRINPFKVPRVIGKQGSMVSLIKEHTGVNIMVGQNGVVWMQGEDPANENKAEEAIRLIETKSTMSGLTDYMQKWFGGEQ